MKALSLTQPWSTLVVTGEKVIETRSWRTNHHGIIAIHASKGFPAWAKGESHYPPFREAIRRHGYDSATDLPLGAIIGVCTLMGCVRTEDIRDRLESKELLFGNYEDGRFAWMLDEAQQIEPIPCRGTLGLWDVPYQIAKAIKAITQAAIESKASASPGVSL